MEPPEILRQTVPLQPWGSRTQVEGTKCLSLVRMEVGIDLGLPWEGEGDTSPSPAISRKHLGTALGAIKRHDDHSQSAAVVENVHSTPGVDNRGRGT